MDKNDNEKSKTCSMSNTIIGNKSSNLKFNGNNKMISQKENKNVSNAPLMQRQATIDYIISDFNICDLPEQNPMSQCIDDFVSRRNAYN